MSNEIAYHETTIDARKRESEALKAQISGLENEIKNLNDAIAALKSLRAQDANAFRNLEAKNKLIENLYENLLEKILDKI